MNQTQKGQIPLLTLSGLIKEMGGSCSRIRQQKVIKMIVEAQQASTESYCEFPS